MEIIEIYTVPTRGIGLPDYAAPKPVGSVPIGPISTSTDVGELAARLGSPVTFDRSGNVIWYDDFEDNINKWYHAFLGGGGSIILSTDTARNGAKSCKLTTGNLTDNWAFITRFQPYPILSRLGGEISFTVNSDLQRIRFLLTLYNGTQAFYGEVCYVPSTGLLQFRDRNYDWRTFSNNINLYPTVGTVYAFHTMKMVVDYPNLRYTRCIVNNVTYDLSAFPLFVRDTVGSSHMTFSLEIVTNVDANRFIYADDAIITQNEPDNV